MKPIRVLLAFALIVPAVWLYAADGDKKDKDTNKDNPAEKKADAEVLLETVGALAGFQLYQSYLNIGFIADGKAEGTYSEEDVIKILDSVLEALDTLDARLQKVEKLDLVDKDDRETIKDVRLISAQLRQQGDELKKFWKGGKKENGDNYEKARKEAWEGIKKMLNLEE